MVLELLVRSADPVILGLTALGYILLFKTKHRWWLVIVSVTAAYAALWFLAGNSATDARWSLVAAPLFTTSLVAFLVWIFRSKKGH